VSGGFRCPNHGALFANDGNWTGGQRTRDLQSYPTTYNSGAGTLTIG
jgi:Rieske Fe-S protein